MLILLLLLQIALPAEPGIEIELLPPLRGFIQHPLQEGGVRLADGDKLLSLRGSKGERILGVPRLVDNVEGTKLRLQLIQTWLPATRLDLTVADFNNLAFHSGFVEVLWEASCDAMNEHHTCRTLELVFEFLLEYGTVPEGWPTEPKAWPGDDEWVVNRRAW